MKKNGVEFFKEGGTLARGDVLVNLNSVLKGEFTICGVDITGKGEYPLYSGSWFMVDNCEHNNSIIKHFEWRNSTGTPPTYTNLVEVKQRNGIIYIDYVNNIDFTLELSDDDVVQWKPYIECELDWCLTENKIKDIFGDSLAEDFLSNMVAGVEFINKQILEMHIELNQQWPRN